MRTPDLAIRITPAATAARAQAATITHRALMLFFLVTDMDLQLVPAGVEARARMMERRPTHSPASISQPHPGPVSVQKKAPPGLFGGALDGVGIAKCHPRLSKLEFEVRREIIRSRWCDCEQLVGAVRVCVHCRVASARLEIVDLQPECEEVFVVVYLSRIREPCLDIRLAWRRVWVRQIQPAHGRHPVDGGVERRIAYDRLVDVAQARSDPETLGDALVE